MPMEKTYRGFNAIYKSPVYSAGTGTSLIITKNKQNASYNEIKKKDDVSVPIV